MFRPPLLVVVFLAGTVSAAPAPKPLPPPPLSAELLVGTWKFEWGAHRDGQITFHANGEYHSHHGGDGAYWGNWTLEDGVVELLESPLDEYGVPRDRWTRYTFTLTAADYPTLRGTACGGTAVVLS